MTSRIIPGKINYIVVLWWFYVFFQLTSDDGDDSSSSADGKEPLEAVPTAAPPPTPEKKKNPRPVKAHSQTQMQKPQARKPLRVGLSMTYFISTFPISNENYAFFIEA